VTRLLYEGKAKQVFATDAQDVVRIHFKDEATAFDGKKRGIIAGKGAVNARVSALLFEYLGAQGVATHYLGLAGDRDLLARRVSIIPLEVVVRNVAAGSLAKRLGWEEGRPVAPPILELYLKDDALGDPLINQYHVRALALATDDERCRLEETALVINGLLIPYLAKRGLRLVDFKLEFGRDGRGDILLADELSPDTCRFWDSESGYRMDKDRFRRDLGGVTDAYQEVLRRLEGGGSDAMAGTGRGDPQVGGA
jgi:phosphoribosylaminoimidazole-succinocarboxamide synthase